MSKSALIVVERSFLTAHVGVRRVILHYWQQLEANGFAVTLATPSDGRLIAAKTPKMRTIDADLATSREDAPVWRSEQPDVFSDDGGSRRAKSATLVWTDRTVDPAAFDISLLSNPWLCAQGLADMRFSAGIIYDMVPNLLACGALNLGAIIDVYRFAEEHDVGYRYFLRNLDAILCISESARHDFCAFYKLGELDRERVKAVIPFVLPTLPTPKARPGAAGEVARILLVNVLDPRKNFVAARETLKRVAAEAAFDVDIVGRERMPVSVALEFLRDLGRTGGRVRWYRSASEACLNRLYARADVLLFPSLYEGLGLPILEAQAHGVPVVSADTSSCGEINLNPGLAVDPLDHAALARAVLAALHGDPGLIVGRPLQNSLLGRLGERWTFDGALPQKA